jgi:DENN (AEX-3) domain
VKFGFTIHDCWTIERPPENQLPLVNFSFQPLFTCLSISNILVVVGCLLQETRVALVSKHYAVLGPAAEALLNLLFPFHWQGMYLPILPYNMLEILDAPVPYLVGLHSRFLSEVPVERRPTGVVIVDLDRDEVHLGFDDASDSTPRHIPSLPDRHAMKLKTKLVEFASGVYVVPNTQRVGYISNGLGVEVSTHEREPFAQTSLNESPTTSPNIRRRRDVVPLTDKAFRDNELLVPISGFLSEQGYLYQREERPIDTPEKKTSKFPFKMHRFLKSPVTGGGDGSTPTLSSFSPDLQPTIHDGDNILDMNEVRTVIFANIYS